MLLLNDVKQLFSSSWGNACVKVFKLLLPLQHNNKSDEVDQVCSVIFGTFKVSHHVKT